jgi:ATP-dependent Lhr-like helicase
MTEAPAASVFSRLAPRLQQAIAARLGWSSLRPVQELAGEALLDGANAVVQAPTAGGKTEASMFPTLSQLVSEPTDAVGALYIAPLKALLNNQAERLGQYTEMVGLRRFVWHGDVTSSQRKTFLREPTELLMTTPESLEVMLVSQRVHAAALFHDLRTVVIDEIHAMAGTDRGAHLLSVLERVATLSRHDVQRVGLSATVGNPAAIVGWLQGTSRRVGCVINPTAPPARRALKIVRREDLGELARDAAKVAAGGKSLFFCQSRSTTEAVAERMRSAGIEVFVHHSAVSREERALAEEQFHRGSDACIVCTSTLELGIDVGDLDRVLQAEAPSTVGSFLQRLGRTGRRGDQVANATFFCTADETVLQAVALIELARARWVEDVVVDDRCWPVMIHQLLAMSLASDGISRSDAWAQLSRVPDFRGIHRAEFDRLIRWMLRDRSLAEAGGLLLLGPKAERRFGKRNFMDLYAVFQSPQSYRVQTAAGQELGTLQQDFVDRLVDDVSCFLLAGRAWVVHTISHDDRRVVVHKAPRGREPTWGGYLPQFLGFELCQQIRRVLASEESYKYLGSQAAASLAERRESLGSVASAERGALQSDDGELTWWTFAGGRINSTLTHALRSLGHDWKIVSSNFSLRIQGEQLSETGLREAIEQLRDVEFWENEALWRDVAEGLPGYRLSKFQGLMPPWVERETIAAYLLDVAGAWHWLSGGAAALSSSRRIPASVGAPTQAELQRAPVDEEEREPAPPTRDEDRPIIWVESVEDLERACAVLEREDAVGLDVETILRTRALCLIQIAGAEATYLIDALAVPDLSPLGPLLEETKTTKLIHNAAFERSILRAQGFELDGVVDTMHLSWDKHGRKAEGGHSLKVVCERELGTEISKFWQVSDWSRRPLTPGQVAYAALDAEVLRQLHDQIMNHACGDSG